MNPLPQRDYRKRPGSGPDPAAMTLQKLAALNNLAILYSVQRFTSTQEDAKPSRLQAPEPLRRSFLAPKPPQYSDGYTAQEKQRSDPQAELA